MFLSAVWTLTLTAPIHWWASDVMIPFFKSSDEETHSGWPEGEYNFSHIFIFRWTIPTSEKFKLEVPPKCIFANSAVTASTTCNMFHQTTFTESRRHGMRAFSKLNFLSWYNKVSVLKTVLMVQNCHHITGRSVHPTHVCTDRKLAQIESNCILCKQNPSAIWHLNSEKHCCEL